MAPENQRSSISPARPVSYEAVETGYDPGQLVASEPAVNAPSSAPSRKNPISRARARHVNRHDYKPTALRWWFHAALITLLAALIGLAEYTIRTLQVYDGDDLVSRLWSRGDRVTYEETERKAGITTSYLQRIPRTFENASTSPSLQYSSAASISLSTVSVVHASTTDYLDPGPTTITMTIGTAYLNPTESGAMMTTSTAYLKPQQTTITLPVPQKFPQKLRSLMILDI